MCQIKNHIVYERSDLKLSSNAFILISIILTEMDLFEEGEGGD